MLADYPKGAPETVRVLHLSAADSILFPILRDQLVYLRERGFEIHTASIDGPLARRLRDEDHFPWTPLPLTRSVAPFSDFKALDFIQELCKREKFSIVHTHTPKGNLVGQWAARWANVPNVVQTLHGFYFHERMSWAARRAWIAIERFSASHSDYVLCQNPEDVETAVREGIVPRAKISLLGNGIDLSLMRPAAPDDPRRMRVRAELGLKPADELVGMVGRFVDEKGFPEFIRAATLLSERRPGVHFLAVGHALASERVGEKWVPPELSPALRSRFKILSDRDDMADLYAAMDVHVLPSHREGFPRALMEGAATGLAQVCTNIRGCRQTVEDGATGFFMPVGDAGALAAHIETLLANPLLSHQMGRAARIKAEKEFDQRAVFSKVEQCYRNLLAR